MDGEPSRARGRAREGCRAASLSYGGGFGGSVGYGWKGGASLGLSYSAREGFGIQGGLQVIEGLGLNVGVNQSGGYSGGFRVGNLGDSGRSSLNLGYRYSKFTGGTTSLSYTSVSNADHGFSTTGGLTFNGDAGFGVSGGVGWTTDTRSNNFTFGFNRRGVNAGFTSRSLYENKPMPGNPVPRNANLASILAAVADPRLRDGLIAQGVLTEEQMGAFVDADGEGEGILGDADGTEFTGGSVEQYSDVGASDWEGRVSSMAFNKNGNKGASAHRLVKSIAGTYGDVSTSQARKAMFAANGVNSYSELQAKINAGETINFPDGMEWREGATQKVYSAYVKIAEQRALQQKYRAGLATTLKFLPGSAGNNAPELIDTAVNGFANFWRDRFNDASGALNYVSDKLSETRPVQYVQDKLASVYNGIETVLTEDFAYSDTDNLAERFAKAVIKGGGRSAQFLTEIAMDPAGKLADVYDFMGNKAITGLQGWWNSDMSLGDTVKYMDRLAQQALYAGADRTAQYAGQLVEGEKAAMLAMASAAGVLVGDSMNPFQRGVKMLRAARGLGISDDALRAGIQKSRTFFSHAVRPKATVPGVKNKYSQFNFMNDEPADWVAKTRKKHEPKGTPADDGISLGLANHEVSGHFNKADELDPVLLRKFSEHVKAPYYQQWPGYDPVNRNVSDLSELILKNMNEAKIIHFNMDKFTRTGYKKFVKKWGDTPKLNGTMMRFRQTTSWEYHTIIRNPELRKKTIFYGENGRILSADELF